MESEKLATRICMPSLTIQEAAEPLRVRVTWLYERTRTNSVPHAKLGKYLRFDRDELAAWVDKPRRDRGGSGAVSRLPGIPRMRTRLPIRSPSVKTSAFPLAGDPATSFQPEQEEMLCVRRPIYRMGSSCKPRNPRISVDRPASGEGNP
jgi:excisionase family DNA binding protein